VSWLIELHFGDVSDGWWRGGLLVDSLGGPSSGCKCWIILLGDIAMDVFELRTRWASNVGVNS
jgi:hypothetical protein